MLIFRLERRDVIDKSARRECMWESGGITPDILNVSTKWSGFVRFAPQATSPPGKGPSITHRKEDRDIPKTDLDFLEKSRFIFSCRESKSIFSAVQSKACSLYWLSCLGFPWVAVYHKFDDRLNKVQWTLRRNVAVSLQDYTWGQNIESHNLDSQWYWKPKIWIYIL